MEEASLLAGDDALVLLVLSFLSACVSCLGSARQLSMIKASGDAEDAEEA